MKFKFTASACACLPLIIACALIAAASVSQAQNGAPLTWTGNASTSWTSGGNWSGSTVPANTVTFATGNRARFSAANPTNQPMLTSARSIFGIQFWAQNYVIGGGDNVLTVGVGGIEVAANMNAQVNTVLAGGTQSYAIAADGVLVTTRAVTNSGTLSKTGLGTWEIANGIVSASTGFSITEGTVRLGDNNRISSGTNINLSNATLDLSGYSNASGTLLVNGTGVIDFGAALTTSILSFSDSSAIDWSLGTLTIVNYKPGSTQLRFGTDANGLTEAQLGRIIFDGFEGAATIDSLGYIAPIPESGTVSLLIGSAAACAIFALHRRRKAHC